MIRILIVDDHAVVREGLKQIVSENDMSVRARRQRPGGAGVPGRECDVVLLDLAMPGKDGLEILKEMKPPAAPARSWSSASIPRSSTRSGSSGPGPPGT